mgnify:CR=1 FL=1
MIHQPNRIGLVETVLVHTFYGERIAIIYEHPKMIYSSFNRLISLTRTVDDEVTPELPVSI